jgi:hypothetical protein
MMAMRFRSLLILFVLIFTAKTSFADTGCANGYPPGHTGSSSILCQLLPVNPKLVGTGTNDSFFRYSVNFSGPKPNSNSENQRFPVTQAGGVPLQSLSEYDGVVGINFTNGQNFITTPYDGHFYLHVDASTFNNNTGSGEWNNILFTIYAKPPNAQQQTLCSFQAQQEGGGSDYGGQYVYFNYVNCEKDLVAGTQVTVTASVASGTDGANVYLMHGTLSMQTMPF